MQKGTSPQSSSPPIPIAIANRTKSDAALPVRATANGLPRFSSIAHRSTKKDQTTSTSLPTESLHDINKLWNQANTTTEPRKHTLIYQGVPVTSFQCDSFDSKPKTGPAGAVVRLSTRSITSGHMLSTEPGKKPLCTSSKMVVAPALESCLQMMSGRKTTDELASTEKGKLFELETESPPRDRVHGLGAGRFSV